MHKRLLSRSEFRSPYKFLLCLLLFSINLVFQTASYADELDCSAFKILEISRICQVSDLPVTRHQSVPDDDLNKLVDSWGTTPGLHVIPPAIYSLFRKIKLNPQQIILPDPESPLPENKALRTIELSASKQFSIFSDNYFTLVETSNRSTAAGIEIHGEHLDETIEGFQLATERGYPKTLIHTPDNIGVTLAGLMLSGDDKLNSLLWSSFQDDVYWRGITDTGRYRAEVTGLRVVRSHFEGNDMANLVIIKGGYQFPELLNNALLLNTSDNTQSVGLRIEGGAARVNYNDFVLSGQASGIEMVTVRAVDSSNNAYYQLNTLSQISQAIVVEAPSDSWFSYTEASIQSGLGILAATANSSDSNKASVLSSGNLRMPTIQQYSFADPESFFSYTGLLGTVPVSQAYLASHYGVPSGTFLTGADTRSTANFGELTTLEDLMARAEYFEDCPNYINRFDAIGIPFTFITAIALNIGLGFGCWSCGAGRCPCSPHH